MGKRIADTIVIALGILLVLPLESWAAPSVVAPSYIQFFTPAGPPQTALFQVQVLSDPMFPTFPYEYTLTNGGGPTAVNFIPPTSAQGMLNPPAPSIVTASVMWQPMLSTSTSTALINYTLIGPNPVFSQASTALVVSTPETITTPVTHQDSAFTTGVSLSAQYPAGISSLEYTSTQDLDQVSFSTASDADAATEWTYAPASTYNGSPATPLQASLSSQVVPGSSPYAGEFTFNPNMGFTHLNGTYRTSVTMGFGYNSAIVGAPTNAQSFNVPLSATVSNSSGPASVAVASGSSYSNLSTTLQTGSTPAVTVSLLQGTASGNETITLGNPSQIDPNSPLSGYSLSGSGTDLVAVQVSVPLITLTSMGISPNNLQLMWYDSSSATFADGYTAPGWVPTIDGDSPGPTSLTQPANYVNGLYVPGSALGGGDFNLNWYGNAQDGANEDYWAVIDHNSDFSLEFLNLESVPEPASATMLMLGGGWLLSRRRTKQ